MVAAEIIQTLSRRNISVDGELTKLRTKETLRSASRAAKKDIDALAGLKRVSINRVTATGSISAKVAVAIAQTLGINPFYLTGEADDKGAFTEKLLLRFLTDKGYGDLVASLEKPVRRRRASFSRKDDAPEQLALFDEPTELPEEGGSEAEEAAPPTDDAAPDVVEVVVPEDTQTLDALSEEETVQVLRSLFIQAKYSCSAYDVLNKVKALLMSK